jgi:CBS-domain-containing membrane protein
MKASDIMTVGAVTVHPDSTISYAAQMMVDHRVSGLPVVNAQGQLVGMITEADLLRREELGTADPAARRLDFWVNNDRLAHYYAREHGRKVEDVMSRDVVSVGPDEPVGRIVELMEAGGLKRVPVVKDGRVIGIVSRANFLPHLARPAGEAPQPVIDDLAIRKSIADKLADETWARAATIDIDVHDGVVTLRGTVNTGHAKDAVRALAENAPGVVRVWDNIRTVDSLPKSGDR